MTRSIFALLPVALLLPACTPHKAIGFTEVEVAVASYRVDGAPVETMDGVIARLHAVSKLESIYLHTSPGVANERYTAARNAIRAAGIEVPIATVGNELFNK